ncbi:hypothetical protein FA95DRAFT_1559601 [Auriscalpium vulgare]|uniref:Uncharacterized protein n=1 Tax=Auriscalpium vulgare TaxID=40419 RepID=A0ACB8RRM2_9AGAM|nr:hypothetical protein FA95DRAFT_1559601 [Auriscalpium vulgare]
MTGPCLSLRLPPEIWGEIFEHVAFVPGLMDVDVADPFATPTTTTPFAPFSRTELRRSLRKRLSLALVCKTWHPTALPFLYRCVHIRRDADAQNLEPVLRRSGLLLGSYVRHLIVDIDGAPKHDWTPLAQCFPNLEILTAPEAGIVCKSLGTYRLLPSRIMDIREPIKYPETPFLRSLAEACGQALLRLHVNTDYVTREDFNNMLALMPRLRTLLHGHHHGGATLELFRPPHLTFVTIHDGIQSAFKDIEEPFPSVRHAFVYDRLYHHGTPTDLLRFLTIQGPLLTTFHLDVTGVARSTSLADVLRGCPNLAHLILYFRALPLWMDMHTVGFVPCLGIHVKEPDRATVTDYMTFIRSLGHLDCPSRRVVRVLNPEVSGVVRPYLEGSTKAADTEVRQKVAAGLLQVEDHTGRPMGRTAAAKP